MKRILLVVALASLVPSGCRNPIGVSKTGFQPVYQELSANVLDEDILSATTQQALAFLGLDDRYRREPAAVIAELEATNQRERRRRLHVTIAELHYKLALAKRDRGRFLASAVHAYLYLLGEDYSEPPNPYSPRFRLACDLYNRGLARAMLAPTGEIVLADVDAETPHGTIAIQSTRPGFPWDEEMFSVFLPADTFLVRGLRARIRDAGLGVPLIAIQTEKTRLGLTAAESGGRAVKLPATAFLRLDGGLDEYLKGELEAHLELYLAVDIPAVEVADKRVPLEADLTAPLAYTLQKSRIWDFGISGFLKSKLKDYKTGVFMAQPYQEGKIPLVLIHGTASSPATWAEMVNSLTVDPRLRSRYQVWLALYTTGNPITYSAGLLRADLAELHDKLDPEGDDPALSNMVIVGHSQGGLITRLLLSASGDRMWSSFFDEPFETFELEPQMREVLAQALFFEPVPFARRGVFISTPHRGSYVADRWLGKLAARLVELPRDLAKGTADLLKRSDLPEELRKLPTSVDNMDPDSRFGRTLVELPFGPGVPLHSIIAVKPGYEIIEEGNDGVVEYSSAQLEGVESELVVRHGHSCLGEPATFIELRRILLQHLEEWDRRFENPDATDPVSQ